MILNDLNKGERPLLRGASGWRGDLLDWAVGSSQVADVVAHYLFEGICHRVGRLCLRLYVGVHRIARKLCEFLFFRSSRLVSSRAR